jgi:hypothetical protein
MATTTTNFGWDIPESTDLVKDGATAIAALGQDIDTALIDLKGGTTGQVLSKASGTDLDFSWVNAGGGLTYITGASFTNTAAQSINNCFTSTYQNYRVVGRIKCQSSVATGLMRLRASGSDNTTSNYYSVYNYTEMGAVSAGTTRNGAVGDGFLINNTNGTGYVEFSLDVYAPQMSLETQISNLGAQKFGSNYYAANGGGVFNATTSFDGFTLYVSLQNITGEVRVYGYQNS